MITPDAFVRDVHTLFTLTGRLNYHAVSINNRFFKEFVRLRSPNTQADSINDVHYGLDIRLAKAAAEVPRRGGVRNPLGPEGIQIDLIVP